jgi:hypothetical protein
VLKAPAAAEDSFGNKFSFTFNFFESSAIKSRQGSDRHVLGTRTSALHSRAHQNR